MTHSTINKLADTIVSVICFPPVFMVVPGFLLLRYFNIATFSVVYWSVAAILLIAGYSLQRQYGKLSKRPDRSSATYLNMQLAVILGYGALMVWLCAISQGAEALAWVVGLLVVGFAGLLVGARHRASIA